MCPNIGTSGICPRSRCSYAHNDTELRFVPDLSRTRMCDKARTSGVCDDNDCRFAHDIIELRSTDRLYKT